MGAFSGGGAYISYSSSFASSQAGTVSYILTVETSVFSRPLWSIALSYSAAILPLFKKLSVRVRIILVYSTPTQ